VGARWRNRRCRCGDRERQIAQRAAAGAVAPGARAAAARACAFEGDIALREMRARSPLDPDAVPEPPVVGSRSSSYSWLARLSGAVGFAALAAVFVVSGTPGSRQDAGDEGAKPFWSRLFGASVTREAPSTPKVTERKAEVTDRPVPMMERFAAATPVAEPPVTTQPSQQQLPQQQAVEAPAPAAPPQLSPPAPALDREEIAALYKRGEQLIQQGDVAAARLMFARAAKVGDARSALALGRPTIRMCSGSSAFSGSRPMPRSRAIGTRRPPASARARPRNASS